MNHPGPLVSRTTLRRKRMLISLPLIGAILLLPLFEKGPSSTVTIAATTALLGCPVGPSAQQEFDPNQPPVEIVAIWSRTKSAPVAIFVKKYVGCLTTSLSVSGATRTVGVPPNSSFEIAEFFGDASTRQIDGVTRAFQHSGLFTEVVYGRALPCPGVTFQSFGYCVKKSGNQWAINAATG